MVCKSKGKREGEEREEREVGEGEEFEDLRLTSDCSSHKQTVLTEFIDSEDGIAR
jgi:hypothetical protein